MCEILVLFRIYYGKKYNLHIYVIFLKCDILFVSDRYIINMIGGIDMVTLTFDFNEDRVMEAGHTTDELLAPMREHAKKYGIDEVEYGVFAKDGINALAAIAKFVVNVSLDYLDYLNTWMMNVDGEVEDCKSSILKYNEWKLKVK